MSSEGWTSSPETPPTGGNPDRPIDPKAVRVDLMPVALGLPFGWYVEYQGWTGDESGMVFVIARPQIRWTYSDFVCLMSRGLPNRATDFRQVPVLGVTRWRDGGTTEVRTVEGSFLFPSPFARDGEDVKPTFRGEEITLHQRFQGACG